MSRRKAIQERNAAMAMDRARGLTIREIAAKYGVSKSHVHRVVQDIDVPPPHTSVGIEIVQIPGGGYTYHIVTMPQS